MAVEQPWPYQGLYRHFESDEVQLHPAATGIILDPDETVRDLVERVLASNTDVLELRAARPLPPPAHDEAEQQ